MASVQNEKPMSLDSLLPLPTGLSTPRAKGSLRRFTQFLVPSFLQRADPNAREIYRPTDFLDGLRGYAAFVVFIHHFFMPVWTPGWQMGYGGGHPRALGADDHYIWQLPYIRLLFSGPPCVYLFFVVSGFSISLKPIQLVRAGAWPKFLDTIVSATFRRACRLYVPCIVMLFISLILSILGCYDFAWSHRRDWPVPGGGLKAPQPAHTAFGQINHWFWEVLAWADPLPKKSGPYFIAYSVQAWTIPVELKCSLVCWIALIGLARVRTYIRIGVLTTITVYWHLQKKFDAPLFFAGQILAELYLIRSEKEKETEKVKGSPREESQKEKAYSWAAFLFALFLLGFPRRGGERAYGWPLLNSIPTYFDLDQTNFFLCIGSVLLIWIVSRSPSLQTIFTSHLARYLGKLSFSIYLVHQAMLTWFGYRLIPFFWAFVGDTTTIQYGFGLGLAFFTTVVIVVWAADIFMRAVDGPSVEFARWVEGKCRAE